MSPILGIWSSAQQAAFAGSYESIATVTVGAGGSSSITFSSIPSTYKHLQIRGISQNTVDTYSIQMQVNSDTGNNYSWHQVYGLANATVAAAAGSTTNKIAIGVPNATGTFFAPIVIDVLDYTNTSKYKTVRSLSGFDQNNGQGFIGLISGLWQSTSAITSITFNFATGNFAQYSQFALFGVKG